MQSNIQEIKELIVTTSCSGKCESCERYFDCNLPRKETFKQKGILTFIQRNLEHIKHKVAILGGKGGVGKSMLAVNLAVGLSKRGKKVCIVDQSYDCPAIPMMMGIPQDYRLRYEDGFIPAETKYGPKVISTGLILDPDEIIIWFSEMKRNATEEILACTKFGELDYLVFDIPTGTSAETINVLKYLPDLDGGIVVTVPSSVSQNVARKCIYVLRKAGIPVIGVVENMSDTYCPKCGKLLNIISKDAGRIMSEQEGCNFLGKIPLLKEMSKSLDEGHPFVDKYPDHEVTKTLMNIADAVISFCEKEKR